jgi:cation diffusion facilitator family transporter
MDDDPTRRWRHEHAFVADAPTVGERRTRLVVGLTFVMMVAEVAAGLLFGSMALLADGWHMGTHAAAIGLATYAYVFERRHARDPRYTFGPGKARALGGFASAVGLAAAALFVFVESAGRLFAPVSIRYDEALAVAALGLVVNLGSALLLRHDEHDHAGGLEGNAHPDHNLRAAYLHVLADALTSVLALGALFAGKLAGWVWLDPAMGLVGALVIARWSWGLLRDTGAVLLDAEVDPERLAAIRGALEGGGDADVVDLHVWRVGPGHFAAIAVLVSARPREPDAYRQRLTAFPDLAHVTVEVIPAHVFDATVPSA